jgi:hypothetical protein
MSTFEESHRRHSETSWLSAEDGTPILLENGTLTSSMLLTSVWELERRGYIFCWSDQTGLSLELADWYEEQPDIPIDERNPLLSEPGWEPGFVLDHIAEVAVLVQYQTHRDLPLQ